MPTKQKMQITFELISNVGNSSKVHNCKYKAQCILFPTCSTCIYHAIQLCNHIWSSCSELLAMDALAVQKTCQLSPDFCHPQSTVHGSKSITIKANDTDILVIVCVLKKLGLDQLWLACTKMRLSATPQVLFCTSKSASWVLRTAEPLVTMTVFPADIWTTLSAKKWYSSVLLFPCLRKLCRIHDQWHFIEFTEEGDVTCQHCVAILLWSMVTGR